jgi:hypothetical protein
LRKLLRKPLAILAASAAAFLGVGLVALTNAPTASATSVSDQLWSDQVAPATDADVQVEITTPDCIPAAGDYADVGVASSDWTHWVAVGWYSDGTHLYEYAQNNGGSMQETSVGEDVTFQATIDNPGGNEAYGYINGSYANAASAIDSSDGQNEALNADESDNAETNFSDLQQYNVGWGGWIPSWDPNDVAIGNAFVGTSCQLPSSLAGDPTVIPWTQNYLTNTDAPAVYTYINVPTTDGTGCSLNSYQDGDDAYLETSNDAGTAWIKAGWYFNGTSLYPFYQVAGGSPQVVQTLGGLTQDSDLDVEITYYDGTAAAYVSGGGLNPGTHELGSESIGTSDGVYDSAESDEYTPSANDNYLETGFYELYAGDTEYFSTLQDVWYGVPSYSCDYDYQTPPVEDPLAYPNFSGPTWQPGSNLTTVNFTNTNSSGAAMPTTSTGGLAASSGLISFSFNIQLPTSGSSTWTMMQSYGVTEGAELINSSLGGDTWEFQSSPNGLYLPPSWQFGYEIGSGNLVPVLTVSPSASSGAVTLGGYYTGADVTVGSNSLPVWVFYVAVHATGAFEAITVPVFDDAALKDFAVVGTTTSNWTGTSIIYSNQAMMVGPLFSGGALWYAPDTLKLFPTTGYINS